MPWRRLVFLLLLVVAGEGYYISRRPPRPPYCRRQHATGGDDEDSAMLTSHHLERLLGPRLASCLRLIPQNARVVADIGCDHGLLGLALALGDRGRHPMLQRVIGVDRAAAPLAVARRNLARQGQKAEEEDTDAFVVNGRRVELRLGEGLQALSGADGVDTVCMAGIGTKTIVGVLSGRDVLSGVQHLVVQAYDPRPLFMHGLRSHLMSTLKAQRLGPEGKGYAIVDERIVRGAEGRAFVTLLAQATTALGSNELDDVNEKEDDANASFRRLLLGRYLRQRAAHEAQTRVLYEEYLRHHREWYAQVLAARAQSSTGEKGSGGSADPAVRALVAIEQELLDLQRCKM